MNISHNGFQAGVITLKEEGTIELNAPVAMQSNEACKAASNNNDFIGIAVSKHADLIGVQVTGYVEMSYTGTAPTINYCGLVATGTGAVKSSDTGRKYKVLKVDTQNKTVGFILY